MSRQMPELYLRGSIFSNTMKNLSKEQLSEVEEKLELLLHTPSLTKSREKFCQTLANTIGADYREDKDAALQEYKIALMKAIVYVLFHKPNRQVFSDPIQTRKLFSQFTYNYMKQILNENKIPRDVHDKYIENEPYAVAFAQIKHMLEEEGIFHVCDHRIIDRYIIDGDIGLVSLRTAKKIGKLKERYSKFGVNINADIDKIEIIRTKTSPTIKTKIRTSSKIHIMNLDHNDDEENELTRYNIEFEISKKVKTNPHEFDPSSMRKILPTHLADLFDMIIDDKAEQANKNVLAKTLNVSVGEINKRLDQMKYYYYASKAI